MKTDIGYSLKPQSISEIIWSTAAQQSNGILNFNNVTIAGNNAGNGVGINYDGFYGYIKNSIIFGTPIIDTNYYNLKEKINKLPYDLYAIQYRLLYIF